jgi:ankyrin repeat protein
MQTFGGRTPLTIAARHNRLEVVKVLLEADVKVDQKVREFVRSFVRSFIGVFKPISATKKKKDPDGDTPLMMAAANGSLEMTRVLLNNGAAVDLKVGH